MARLLEFICFGGFNFFLFVGIYVVCVEGAHVPMCKCVWGL
jgi:putative flippase GtrA